jgi:hypothetical protein
MGKLNKEQWLGILRHTLTFAGGIGVTVGYIDAAVVTEVIGLTISLVGIVWSVLTKK